MGFKLLLVCFCNNVFPRPDSLASVVTMLSVSPLKTWLCDKFFFRLLKSVLRSSVHSHFVPFFSNCLMLSVYSNRCGKNCAKYCIAPRKEFNVFVFVGAFRFLIASVFSLFGLILYCEIVCPSHTIYFWKNFDFLLLAL